LFFLAASSILPHQSRVVCPRAHSIPGCVGDFPTSMRCTRSPSI
jgi:hypothetical protein